MKQFTVILVIVFLFTGIATDCVLADDSLISTLNSKYKMTRIKHKAKSGGSHGGAHYEYFTDEDVEPGSTGVGNIDMGRNASVRRVFLAVDLKKRHHFKKDGDTPLRIGNVTSQSGCLTNATIIVNVAQSIRY